MNMLDLKRIALEVETENYFFSDKSNLDSLRSPSRIVGRQDKGKDIARFLLGYKKGHVVPFISVYGRSGSGKSSTVKFVLENLDSENISYKFVNLREARTVFGCANLILSELGKEPLKSAQGINVAVDQIGKVIESILELREKERPGRKLFVLVLDEFDAIFYDKRSSPADFIYKLLVMQEKLRQSRGLLVTIIAISNNVMSDYEIDDRVRSRIGSSSEVFFEPYGKQDVLEILKDRADVALAEKVETSVLQYCAELSWEEHGDARRAIDMLRVAAEIAGMKGDRRLTREHLDLASLQLQKDRIAVVISNASYHLKVVCAALARLSYLSGEKPSSTSSIYNEYCNTLSDGAKPLSYRRISELLTELENSGLVVSHTRSKGRQGYGTQFRLAASSDMIGRTCFPDWWKTIVRNHEIEDLMKTIKHLHRHRM